MPRIRYLKPDFFTDEDIAKLPYEARLVFEGLWVHADRAGRLEDRPKALKVKIMPYDDVNIDGVLQLLAKTKPNRDRPFIIRYEVDGEYYIQIVNWTKHQTPHHTERSSEIPPYPPNKDKDKEKCSSRKLELSNGSLTVKDINLLFDEIWGRYPLRVGKKGAYRHFASSIHNAVDNLLITKALNNYLASERVKKGYIQNGSTWFNNWQDWIESPEKKTKPHIPAEPEKPKGRRWTRPKGGFGDLVEKVAKDKDAS